MLKHIIFFISGFSGVGKDEVANRLVNRHCAVHFGLVDAAKRHMADLYGFSEEQLFGPSHMRNAGDGRYPKAVLQKMGAFPYDFSDVPIGLPSKIVGKIDPTGSYWACDGRFNDSIGELLSECPYIPLKLGNARHLIPTTNSEFFLSPRETLQAYCALMQDLFETTWPQKAIGDAVSLLRSMVKVKETRWTYDRMAGRIVELSNCKCEPVRHDGFTVSCFSDVRHKHDIQCASQLKFDDVYSILVRVTRPSVPLPPFDHRSETEQAMIPNSVFDFIIDNDGSLDDLGNKVDVMVQKVKEKIR